MKSAVAIYGGPNYVHWKEGKCVFMLVNKCGNSSIKAALLETMGGVNPDISVHKDTRLTYVGYSFIQKTELPVIAVVRRPYDRLKSFWRDKVAGRTAKNFNFNHVRGMYPDMPFRVMLERIIVAHDDHLSDPHIVPATVELGRVNPFAEVTVVKFEDLINPARGGWERIRQATAAPDRLPAALPHLNAATYPMPQMPLEAAWRLRQRVFQRYYQDYLQWDWEV